MFKLCVIYDRFCNNCGECNYCDLDSSKICDNCCRCLDDNIDYRAVKVDKIVLDDQ